MKLLPADAQTYSKSPNRYAVGAPSEIVRAYGAHVVSPEGRHLIDLTSGLGALILGHGETNAAIDKQLQSGICFPLPGHLEHEVAQMLVDVLTWEKAETVRFGKNGADATGAAVRLARAYTGRTMVAYLDYHGHHPWSMIEPPMNGGVVGQMSVRLPRVESEIIRAAECSGYACIVLEPFPSNDHAFAYSDGFWDRLRKACDDSGTLLVIDEMVSGFRCAPGGGAELLGIEPDIGCYGKAMANGMPLSAVVGPWEITKLFEESVFYSTTHGGEALSLASARSTIKQVSNGGVLRAIANAGLDIIDECNAIGLPYLSAYPQRIVFPGLTDAAKEAMLDEGVLCAGYANLTASHVGVVDRIIDSLRAAARHM